MYYTDFTTPGEVASFYRPTSASNKPRLNLSSSLKSKRPLSAAKFSMISREDDEV